MHPQNIVSILNHKQMLSVTTLKKLSRHENVSLNWLLLGIGEQYLDKPASSKKKAAAKKPAKKPAKTVRKAAKAAGKTTKKRAKR